MNLIIYRRVVLPAAAGLILLTGCGGDGGNVEFVIIGNKMWMKKNLNIETADSYCYENSPDSCAKYGRLYTWKAAKTACPDGWHLPTRKEWRELVREVDPNARLGIEVDDNGRVRDIWDESNIAGNKLKSASGWHGNGNGTDEFGFSALPGGDRHYTSTGGSFCDAGLHGNWWTATGADGGNAYYRSISHYKESVSEHDDEKSDYHSVRCVGNRKVSNSKASPVNGKDVSGGTNCTSAETCRTVTIGGVTWMAENLNIVTANSWCYHNSADSCAKYGRLYAWKAAKTACPDGWHLPTREEWRELVRAVDANAKLSGDWDTVNVAGKALKSTGGWNDYDKLNVRENGTDEFGFSALPGGGRYTDLGVGFSYAGYFGGWWTATKYSFGNAYYRAMSAADYVYENYNGKSYGLSVRCVMN